MVSMSMHVTLQGYLAHTKLPPPSGERLCRRPSASGDAIPCVKSLSSSYTGLYPQSEELVQDESASGR